MTKTKIEAAPAVNRTSAGLRDAIFDELDAIRNGTSNPTRANAVAKLAASIVETVRMEIEVQKHSERVPAKTPPQSMQIDGRLALGSNV